MDNCPERMDVADAEAPRPPQIEMGVETVLALEAVVDAL